MTDEIELYIDVLKDLLNPIHKKYGYLPYQNDNVSKTQIGEWKDYFWCEPSSVSVWLELPRNNGIPNYSLPPIVLRVSNDCVKVSHVDGRVISSNKFRLDEPYRDKVLEDVQGCIELGLENRIATKDREIRKLAEERDKEAKRLTEELDKVRLKLTEFRNNHAHRRMV